MTKILYVEDNEDNVYMLKAREAHPGNCAFGSCDGWRS